MASSSIPPSLQITPADGDMIDADIFSDAGGFHNDIDIDIDLSGTPSEINDDIDYMMDDTDAQQDTHQESVQPQIAKDDNMVEEIEDIGTAEDVMVDEITVPEDGASIVSTLNSRNNPDVFFDEIDFDDVEQHTQHNASGEPSTTEHFADAANQHETTERPTSTDETPISDQFTTGHHGGDGSLAITTAEDNTDGSQLKDDNPSPISTRRSPEKKSNDPVASSENLTSSEEPVSSNIARFGDVETVPQPGSGSLRNVDSTHGAGYAPDNSYEHEPSSTKQVTHDEHTAEDTYAGDDEDLRSAHYISTVVVDFNDEQFSLFPPLTGDPQLQQYESYYSLIDDTQLASKNINELFATLRSTLGSSVAVDEELEFQVHDLGLYISETCTECFNFSFEMICDLFHRLNYNDGEQDAQPLFVSLIKKPRFSSRFLKLQEAADQGLGRSGIDFLQNSEEEWNTEQHEEGQYDEDQKHEKVQAVSEAPRESVHEDTTTVRDGSRDVNQTTEPQDTSNLDRDGESHAPEHETQSVTYSEGQDLNFEEDHEWEGQSTEAYHSVSKPYHQAQLGSPVEVFEHVHAVETTTEGYPEEGDDLFDFGEVGDGDLEASSESHTLGNDEADRSYSDDKPTVDKAQTRPSEVAQPYLVDEGLEDKHHDPNHLDHADMQSTSFPDTEGKHFDSAEYQHDELGRDDEATNNPETTEFKGSEAEEQQWDDFQADESWEIEDGGSNLDDHSGDTNIQEPDPQNYLGSPHDDRNYQPTNDPGQQKVVHKESVADDDDFLIDWSDDEEETKPPAAKTSAELLSESTPRKRSYHDFDSDIEDPVQDHTPPKRTRIDNEQKSDTSKSTTHSTIESGG